MKLMHYGIAQSVASAVVLDGFDVKPPALAQKKTARSETDTQPLIVHHDPSLYMKRLY